VIAPGAVIGDVHALLALAGGAQAPSMSIVAWSKKASGCPAQTLMRTSSKMSSSVCTLAG
jgi:hypothetical protein